MTTVLMTKLVDLTKIIECLATELDKISLSLSVDRYERALHEAKKHISARDTSDPCAIIDGMLKNYRLGQGTSLRLNWAETRTNVRANLTWVTGLRKQLNDLRDEEERRSKLVSIRQTPRPGTVLLLDKEVAERLKLDDTPPLFVVIEACHVSNDGVCRVQSLFKDIDLLVSESSQRLPGGAVFEIGLDNFEVVPDLASFLRDNKGMVPCPFCGSSHNLEYQREPDNRFVCLSCGTQGPIDHASDGQPEDAIRALWRWCSRGGPRELPLALNNEKEDES